MGTQSTWGSMRAAVVAALALTISKVSCDWAGTGELGCYAHLSTDVSTSPGSANVMQGTLNCRPGEWQYPDQDLGPEAMFFTGAGFDFQIWAWDYHEPNIPSAECVGEIWYLTNDNGAGYCTPNKDVMRRAGVGVAMLTALEKLF